MWSWALCLRRRDPGGCSGSTSRPARPPSMRPGAHRRDRPPARTRRTASRSGCRRTRPAPRPARRARGFHAAQPRRQAVGEQLGRAEGEEDAGREHGVDEAEGVAQHDPPPAVALLGDELIVGVGRDVRHPLGVAGDGDEPGVGRDGALEPLLGRASEACRVVLIQHDADRQPFLERDAPAPPPASPRAMRTCPGASSQRKPSKWAKCATSLRGPSRAGIASTRAAWRARPVASTMRWGGRSASAGAAARVSGASASSADVAGEVTGCSRARTRTCRTPAATARASKAASNWGRGMLYAYGKTAGAKRLNVILTRSVGRPDEGHARLDPAERGCLPLEAKTLQDRDDRGDERFPDEQVRDAGRRRRA